MARRRGRNSAIFRSLDWWTIGIYVGLLVFGWMSICGASYSYGETTIFSLDGRSGMQLVWIATALVLGVCILTVDSNHFETLSTFIYILFVLLLVVTIFASHEVKGSRSWLVVGPLRLQPAEFAKFATALLLSHIMSQVTFTMASWRNAALAVGVILLPMVLIVAQNEVGGALVYLAFFLVLYREGMMGSILFTGVALVVYFVVGMKYDDILLSITPTSVGKYIVLILIELFTCGLVAVYCRARNVMTWMVGIIVGVAIIATLFAIYVIPFDITWVLVLECVGFICFLIVQWLRTRMAQWAFIACFVVGSLMFFYSADYAMDNVLAAHQRTRINVLLGLEEDLRGAGYNVHQSEIAIGSGGLLGKGFLNGTQTKLKYVPEQDTDFIFCTVGEEEGFIGSAAVLLAFLFLILRLIYLSERQPFAFGRIYGYCVVSIFLFHILINVGMVLGLMPVIGIPLPFFSYGGSSLWGFTILLFIFLRIDADRHRRLFA